MVGSDCLHLAHHLGLRVLFSVHYVSIAYHNWDKLFHPKNSSNEKPCKVDFFFFYCFMLKKQECISDHTCRSENIFFRQYLWIRTAQALFWHNSACQTKNHLSVRCHRQNIGSLHLATRNIKHMEQVIRHPRHGKRHKYKP